jgi:hypothetical protein
MNTIILALAIIMTCIIIMTFSLVIIANTLWNILQELRNNKNYYKKTLKL